MAMLEEIMTQLKQAMRDKDQTALNTLRSLKSAVEYKRAETGAEPTEQDIVAAIHKEAKKRKDAVEQYTTAGREDLAAKERSELAIIEQFLPKELSDEEIESVAKRVIEQIGASTKKDMGNVMKHLMPELKGAADGKRVNQIVTKLLA